MSLYRNAISHFQKIWGHRDTIKVYVVSKTIEGLRRSIRENKDLRVPISFLSFIRIFEKLPFVCRSPYEASLFSASFSLAYFSLLRISEVLSIKIPDLHFDSAGHLNLKIPKSKTDQASTLL